jgi:pimeloyl-ACP methyl ester carboxylesterase
VTRHIEPATATFTGAAGNTLAADVYGDGGRIVMLLHGGGQTRYAWRTTAEQIARTGHTAYAIDQRGHGDSAWIPDGSYRFIDFAGDVRAVADELASRAGGARPMVIGASLGGIASLLAQGAAEREGDGPVFSAIVLVDITPRVDRGGVAKIQGFMRDRAQEGFASIAEAADAVAAYLPHRTRPRSHEGLKKNLRQSPDGRWRWHWDPKFLDGPHPVATDHKWVEQALVDSARGLKIPALLVRGASSELVQEAHAREFLELVPHAEFVDVTGARHMVAGDRNDAFGEAILGFLDRLPRPAA